MIRRASTLLPLRDTRDGLEVLMIRRSAELFGGGWWVFPGGSLEAVDSSALAAKLIKGSCGADLPWISAAVRETAEEVNLFLTDLPVDPSRFGSLSGAALYTELVREGVTIDGSAIGYLSNWVTPEKVKKRFDTRFLVAAVEPDVELTPNVGEVDAVNWVAPDEMLSRSRDEYPIIFPTIKHLELLTKFESAEDVLAYAAGLEVVAVQPTMSKGPNGEVVLTVPGAPGFEDSAVTEGAVE